MPEMHFTIEWPDGTRARCYSPSTIVREHLAAGRRYPVSELVARSRAMLNAASERVRQRYGYTCSAAMDQLHAIESDAARFAPEAEVLVVALEEKS